MCQKSTSLLCLAVLIFLRVCARAELTAFLFMTSVTDPHGSHLLCPCVGVGPEQAAAGTMNGGFSSLQNAHLLLIQLTHHLLHCLGFAAHIMLHGCCLKVRHRHFNSHWR